MTRATSFSVALVVLASLGLGCGGARVELPIRESGDYYLVEADPRLCPAPTCGGYFVSLANRTTTPCADGTSQERCYVAGTDWSGMGMLDGRGIVRATLTRQSYEGFGELGFLRVSVAWRSAASTTPSGTFYRLSDGAIRCVVEPCEWIDVETLNSGAPLVRATDIDLSPSGLSSEQQQQVLGEFGRAGLLVAGDIRTVAVTSENPTGRTVVAQHVYTRVDVPRFPVCGGTAQTPCAAGYFCDPVVTNACGQTGLPGVCRAELVPDSACIALYDPVCGCDGSTYGNDCERLRARVQLAYEGECR